MKISVVVPVKNGILTLERCLQSLRSQTIGDELEIVIPDSMSTDGSREVARKYDAKIIDIREELFDHGLTRNIGVNNTIGDLVFFTVQDAWLSRTDLLEKMALHFDDDDVMGVVGHQAVPHEKDKNPFFWYRPFSEPKIMVKHIDTIEMFNKLSQKERQSIIAWDNVVSMYKKKALQDLPFISTGFAEDWIWSYHALLRGWKLLRDPSIIVYHYHHQTYTYAFKAAYSLNYHFFKFFKFRPQLPPLLGLTLAATYHLLKNRRLSGKERLYWIRHNTWRNLGYYFSVLNFLVRMRAGGEKALRKGYNRYCKTIPQGNQKGDD